MVFTKETRINEIINIIENEIKRLEKMNKTKRFW